MTTNETRIADIQAIKRLNASYNFAIDDADAEAWAACFTADGVFNALIEGEKPRGTAALQRFVKTVTDAFGQMHHFTTNEIIDFDIGGDTARQKCYLQFFYKKNGRIEGAICVYEDWLARENGGWKYSRRDVALKNKFVEFTEVA